MDNIYDGGICLFAFNFIPYGFLPCNGASLSMSQNQTLYSLLGTKFGSSGTNFNLPQLTGAAPFTTMNYYICNLGIYPVFDNASAQAGPAN